MTLGSSRVEVHGNGTPMRGRRRLCSIAEIRLRSTQPRNCDSRTLRRPRIGHKQGHAMRDTGTTSQSATPRIPNRIRPGLAQGRSASEPEVALYRSRKPPERSHFRLAALGLESIRYVDTRPPSHMGMKATPADRATHSNCAWPSHRTARAARCSQRIHQRDDQRRRLSAVICSAGHLVIEAVASSADLGLC